MIPHCLKINLDDPQNYRFARMCNRQIFRWHVILRQNIKPERIVDVGLLGLIK
jgi:hypothetical protein